MTLVELKKQLENMETIAFELPNGDLVPAHFHVTEIGKVHKDFIDCGGTVRAETVASLQLWNANDYNHRLHPEKLIKIIALSQKVLGLDNEIIEVEYQGETIGKFNLEFNGKHFLLVSKQTDCLAKSNCGLPSEKKKVKLSELQASGCCEPSSSCC